MVPQNLFSYVPVNLWSRLYISQQYFPEQTKEITFFLVCKVKDDLRGILLKVQLKRKNESNNVSL